MSNFDLYFNEQLENPEFLSEYKTLEPEYEIRKQIIKVRTEQNMTQRELAEKIGNQPGNISRLENGYHSPSLRFLKKVAHALGKELHIELR